VLRFAIPAGGIVAAATCAACALARASGLPLVQQRTAATLVTLILSLCVLVLLAMPLTWPNIMLAGAALAGFVLLFLARAVRGFYALELRAASPGSRCSSLHWQLLRSWASGSSPAGLAATRLRWEANPGKGVSGRRRCGTAQPTAPALALASKVSSATCQVAGMQLPVPAIQPVIGGAPAGSHDTATMACGIGRPGVTV
jgi:hypothetical protein